MSEENDDTGERKRADDTAYTINHAIVCTATDLAAPKISQMTYNRINLGCGHHHGVWGWFVGEFVGDILAVPVTVLLQRHAPTLMSGLRRMMEPVAGPLFRMSAKREAKAWAKQDGFAPDSAEAQEKQRQIYSYEMEHLPQAAVWTGASFIFNVAAQKLLHKQLHQGHHHAHEPLWPLVTSVFIGKSVSTGLLVGVRAAFPDKAHAWDNLAARKVFEPATNAVSRLFGMDSTWEKHVADSQGVSAEAQRG